MSKYIVVEAEEEIRSVKPKLNLQRSSSSTERKKFEEDDEEDQASTKKLKEAEEAAFNCWKSNRRVWRESQVDNEMALMRERVKMRQLQESMRLVAQPVLVHQIDFPLCVMSALQLILHKQILCQFHQVLVQAEEQAE